MTHTRFLRIVLPIAAIPALVVLFLPSDVWPTYVDVVEPLALLLASSLAVFAAFMYRKALRAAFLFLAAFLFIYALAIILFLSYSPLLLPSLQAVLSDVQIMSVIQAVQFINYAMLFLFCLNLLKAINIAKLDRDGRMLFAVGIFISLALALYPLADLIESSPNIGFALSRLVIRLFDAGLIVVLLPVLWLYIQYLKSQQRQSVTFTVIIFGIVWSTLADYLFQLIIWVFPQMLSQGSSLEAAVPEAIFIYGYLIIAAGLFAHYKDADWGFNTIDRTMNGELKLVGEK